MTLRDGPVTMGEIQRFLEVMTERFETIRHVRDTAPNEKSYVPINAALTDFLARRKESDNG